MAGSFICYVSKTNIEEFNRILADTNQTINIELDLAAIAKEELSVTVVMTLTPMQGAHARRRRPWAVQSRGGLLPVGLAMFNRFQNLDPAVHEAPATTAKYCPRENTVRELPSETTTNIHRKTPKNRFRASVLLRSLCRRRTHRHHPIEDARETHRRPRSTPPRHSLRSDLRNFHYLQ
jgi:hypothetical protein